MGMNHHDILTFNYAWYVNVVCVVKKWLKEFSNLSL